MSDSDLITPTQIEHSIDEVWDGERLEERYNFLDYHFEEQGAYLRARAYLDDMRTVTLFGPFERRGSIKKVALPTVEQAALAYLRRRYPKVRQQ